MASDRIEKSPKAPEMEKTLDGLSRMIFGHPRDGSCCAVCGNENVRTQDFRDDLSRREFSISLMCQKCQDEVFSGDDNPDEEGM